MFIRLGPGIIFNLDRDELHYEAVFLPNPLEREQPLTHGSRSSGLRERVFECRYGLCLY